MDTPRTIAKHPAAFESCKGLPDTSTVSYQNFEYKYFDICIVTCKTNQTIRSNL